MAWRFPVGKSEQVAWRTLMVTLGTLTNDIQSKNAGINMICCDVFFADRETFEKVRDSGSLTREKVAAYFHVTLEQIVTFEVDERFLGYKITIQRAHSAGGPSEHDLYGTGLYGPLSEYQIDVAP
jgi:hypothetical protein